MKHSLTYDTSIKTYPDLFGWDRGLKSQITIEGDVSSDEIQRQIADLIVADLIPNWYVMNTMVLRTGTTEVLVIQARIPSIDNAMRILISWRMA